MSFDGYNDIGEKLDQVFHQDSIQSIKIEHNEVSEEALEAAENIENETEYEELVEAKRLIQKHRELLEKFKE